MSDDGRREFAGTFEVDKAFNRDRYGLRQSRRRVQRIGTGISVDVAGDAVARVANRDRAGNRRVAGAGRRGRFDGSNATINVDDSAAAQKLEVSGGLVAMIGIGLHGSDLAGDYTGAIRHCRMQSAGEHVGLAGINAINQIIGFVATELIAGLVRQNRKAGFVRTNVCRQIVSKRAGFHNRGDDGNNCAVRL